MSKLKKTPRQKAATQDPIQELKQLMRKIENRDSTRHARILAERIAHELFSDGAGRTAERLVLEIKDGRDKWVWCRKAVEYQIERILREGL